MGWLEKAGKAVERGVRDTGKAVEKAAQDTGKAVEKGVQDTGKTLEKAAQDTGKAVEKGVQDTGKTLEKAGQDVGWNVDKGFRDTVDAGKAVGRYVERTLKGYGDTLSDAERRIREGKVVDALWHAAIDPVRRQEENLALAAKESELLRTVGSVAATAYGGPGGAAAYAAWLTYRETGDAEMALRVGIIAGATSAGMAAAGTLPADTAGQVAVKAATTGAVGGLAVAAAGGDEEAIKEGFLRSGGMVVVQAGFKGTTGHELDPKASEGEPFCMATFSAKCSPDLSVYERDASGNIVFDAEGNPKIDMSKVDPKVPHVGTWATAEDGSPLIGATETSKSMVAISKVPGMNAMAVFHDQWCISWEIDGLAKQASIVPAVVLTYNGTNAPYLEHLRQTAKDGIAKRDEGSTAAPAPTADASAAPPGAVPPPQPTV
ncbi:hypothetical protein GCM10009416_13220 [Craurococcus roseus]|uniref:Uncharacterized protein n=1 Tax=Craurococcus roseus TaxID=77585 RepID=A0ABN1EVW9_9PROT